MVNGKAIIWKEINWGSETCFSFFYSATNILEGEASESDEEISDNVYGAPSSLEHKETVKVYDMFIIDSLFPQNECNFFWYLLLTKKGVHISIYLINIYWWRL